MNNTKEKKVKPTKKAIPESSYGVRSTDEAMTALANAKATLAEARASHQNNSVVSTSILLKTLSDKLEILESLINTIAK